MLKLNVAKFFVKVAIIFNQNNFFKIADNIERYFGILLKVNLWQGLSKIAQTSHTDDIVCAYNVRLTPLAIKLFQFK